MRMNSTGTDIVRDDDDFVVVRGAETDDTHTVVPVYNLDDDWMPDADTRALRLSTADDTVEVCELDKVKGAPPTYAWRMTGRKHDVKGAHAVAVAYKAADEGAVEDIDWCDDTIDTAIDWASTTLLHAGEF